jgi:hypothetical protein
MSRERAMTTKSHNAKKPKLAVHHSGHDQAPSPLPNLDEGNQDKHKMSFAQHQHELQQNHAASAAPLQEAPAQHLKSDAQQHQQKAGSRK